MRKDKIVTLVTGGAGGLGSAIVRNLVKNGHVVIVNYLSSKTDALRLQEGMPDKCHIIKADVSLRKEVASIAEFIVGEFGKLDNLINNAGIASDGLLIRYPEEEWDRVINSNLKGCYNCIQILLPLLIKAGQGSIINISSYSGIKGKEGQSAYSASKAGMIGLGYSLAKELRIYNITVNTVLPGYMNTQMGASASVALQKAKEESLLHSLSDPDRVAEFIYFLCKNRNITGQIFSLDSRVL